MKKSVQDYFIGQQHYADLPADAIVAHLCAALQCDTTGYIDTSLINYAEFDRLHEVMRASYPHVFASAEYRELGHSILLTLPGSDSTLRGALFMAHQDVVPVVRGTEADWLHGPFSGEEADGYIWGRGALDIKEMVFGILEAAEYLLAHGRSFVRTVYLAFGEDEETLNTGAGAIAEYLRGQGVRLEYVLDEGGGELASGEAYGAPNTTVMNICLGEKGYLDMTLTARSSGGHSSNPWGGTSLGVLAHAIDKIQSHPYAPQLTGVMRTALAELAPYITKEPLKTLVQDIDANAAAITEYCMSSRRLYNQISTTIAPTMICGGAQAGNVMPQDMWANINFRLAGHNTAETVLAASRALVGKNVEVGSLQYNDASEIARMDGYGYRMLTEVLQDFFDDVVLIPTISVGATDAHQYECICDTCLRFAPFIEDAALTETGVHGTNERISRESYLHGIRCLIALMERTCL